MTTINIGGKPRRFALNFATYRLAEKRHGFKINLSELENPTLGMLGTYAWIGFLADDPDLTEDQVLEWLVAADDIKEVESLIKEALGIKEDKEDKEDKGDSESDSPLSGNGSLTLAK